MRKTMNQEKKYTQFNTDEVDLKNYIRIIARYKKLIVSIFLISVIIIGIFSLFLPKVYKIDTLLEIGNFKEEKAIESPEILAINIKEGKYRVLVSEMLDISETEYPEIKTENLNKTNLLRIEILSVNPKRDKEILDKKIEIILAEHEKKLEEKRVNIERKIAEIQESLNFLKTQKIYADEGIASLQITISDLREELNFIQETKVIKQPTISEKPIRPRIAVNMIIAGILGLFFGISFAFGKEWWKQ